MENWVSFTIRSETAWINTGPENKVKAIQERDFGHFLLIYWVVVCLFVCFFYDSLQKYFVDYSNLRKVKRELTKRIKSKLQYYHQLVWVSK